MGSLGFGRTWVCGSRPGSVIEGDGLGDDVDGEGEGDALSVGTPEAAALLSTVTALEQPATSANKGTAAAQRVYLFIV
jgi:hypothetical protein